MVSVAVVIATYVQNVSGESTDGVGKKIADFAAVARVNHMVAIGDIPDSIDQRVENDLVIPDNC